MQNPNQKIVLITGADGALGKSVAKIFLDAGHLVIGTHFPRPNKPTPFPAENLTWKSVDLSSSRSIQENLNLTKLDVLIHCAGGFRWSLIDEVKDEDIDFLLNANLKSSLYLVRKFLPLMKTQNFGRIVLIGARAALHPTQGMGAYTASKAGVHALVEAVADEVKKQNISINAVLPSILDTPANRKDMPQADFNQWVKLENLAKIIYELTSDWGASIHGALIPVSGRI